MCGMLLGFERRIGNPPADRQPRCQPGARGIEKVARSRAGRGAVDEKPGSLILHGRCGIGHRRNLLVSAPVLRRRIDAASAQWLGAAAPCVNSGNLWQAKSYPTLGPDQKL